MNSIETSQYLEVVHAGGRDQDRDLLAGGEVHHLEEGEVEIHG